jgi:hypothetical protein
MSARKSKLGNGAAAKNKDKKYILRRGKNNRKREGHIGAACYLGEKEELKRAAKEEARQMGYRDMSISAYINRKLLLP